MIRRIIRIDEEKCVGCGLCARTCHESAIAMVDGKARLLREDYCDGLGDCLPACPVNAISFEEREAPAYDATAVQQHKAAESGRATKPHQATDADCASCLRNFPVQLQLAPVSAPCFSDADLLIAADCTAYACADFHRLFIQRRTTLIACPKLDEANHAAKLAEILIANDVRSITVTRMTVPCCGGLTRIVLRALAMSGRTIPLQVVTISPDGRVQA